MKPLSMKKLRKRLSKTRARQPSALDRELLAASIAADDSTRIELSSLRAALEDDNTESPIVLIPDSVVRYLRDTAFAQGFANVENYCIYKIFKDD